MYDDVKPSSVPSFATADPAVAVDGLCIDVPAGQGFRRIVDDVSFAIPRGRVLGLVGESGSGKSLTGMALNGLLQMGGARISGGTIRLAGRDVTNLSDRDWRPLRGAVGAPREGRECGGCVCVAGRARTENMSSSPGRP